MAEFFSGNVVLLRDGRADPAMIKASLRQGQRGSLYLWGGGISSANGERLVINPGTYALRLPDGREGIIFVNSVTMNWLVSSHRYQQRVEVVGSGPAPF